MASGRHRDQRLETRVTLGQKKLIERAAWLQGRTVTDFVVSTLQEAAKQAIADHSVWKLTQEQQKAFLEGLMQAPEPNPKLRKAYERLQRHRASVTR